MVFVTKNVVPGKMLLRVVILPLDADLRETIRL